MHEPVSRHAHALFFRFLDTKKDVVLGGPPRPPAHVIRRAITVRRPHVTKVYTSSAKGLGYPGIRYAKDWAGGDKAHKSAAEEQRLSPGSKAISCDNFWHLYAPVFKPVAFVSVGGGGGGFPGSIISFWLPVPGYTPGGRERFQSVLR